MNREEEEVTRVLWPVIPFRTRAGVCLTGRPLVLVISGRYLCDRLSHPHTNGRDPAWRHSWPSCMQAKKNERWPVHHGGEVSCVNGCPNHGRSFSDCNSYTKLCWLMSLSRVGCFTLPFSPYKIGWKFLVSDQSSATCYHTLLQRKTVIITYTKKEVTVSILCDLIWNIETIDEC
jgi:hypothetical protein